MRWKSWDIILHPHQIGDFRILCEKHILEFTKIAWRHLKKALHSVQFEGFTFSGIMTQRINALEPCLNSKPGTSSPLKQHQRGKACPSALMIFVQSTLRTSVRSGDTFKVAISNRGRFPRDGCPPHRPEHLRNTADQPSRRPQQRSRLD